MLSNTTRFSVGSVASRRAWSSVVRGGRIVGVCLGGAEREQDHGSQVRGGRLLQSASQVVDGRVGRPLRERRRGRGLQSGDGVCITVPRSVEQMRGDRPGVRILGGEQLGGGGVRRAALAGRDRRRRSRS